MTGQIPGQESLLPPEEPQDAQRAPRPPRPPAGTRERPRTPDRPPPPPRPPGVPSWALPPPPPGSRHDCRPAAHRAAWPMECVKGCGRPVHLWETCQGEKILQTSSAGVVIEGPDGEPLLLDR